MCEITESEEAEQYEKLLCYLSLVSYIRFFCKENNEDILSPFKRKFW